MLNKHICKALDLVESYQWTIDEIEGAIRWAEETMEDNKNVRQDNTSTANFLAYYQDELEYQNKNLERAKVRLDICVRTFNKGGWTFE